jgi:hypothetical protein
MTAREFKHLLRSLKDLSHEQRLRLRRELNTELNHNGTQVRPAAETAFEVLSRAGLIGCIIGTPRSSADLSTNPKHMEGFGRD